METARLWLQICAVAGMIAVLITAAGRPGPRDGRSPPQDWIVLAGAQAAPLAPQQTTTTPLPLRAAKPATAARASPVTGAPPRVAVTAPSVTRAAIRPPTGQPSDFSVTGLRWDACQMITVSSSGPDVASIVDELASVTGLGLQLVNGPADIMVTWGAIPIRNAVGRTELSANGTTIVHAAVTIAPAGLPFLATLVRHEMGHAVGLGHAHSSDEVMYPVLNVRSPSDYQAGDRTGLQAVGAPASGC